MIKKILLGLFLLGILVVGSPVQATARPVDENVCCESYGTFMGGQTASTYNIMTRSQCLDLIPPGGGRNVVSMNYCTQTTPSITVSSPNGGETYKVGDKVEVKWESENLPTNDDLCLSLRHIESGFGFNLTGSIKDDGSENVYITQEIIEKMKTAFNLNNFPIDKINGKYDLNIHYPCYNGNQFRLTYNGNEYFNVSPYSKPFNIISTKTSTPSIAVISPNGGEVYKQGEEITVKWKTENSNNRLIGFDLVTTDSIKDDSNSNTHLITRGQLVNDGEEKVLIPLNTPNGNNYKFRIASYDMSVSSLTLYDNKVDFSDNTFTISDDPNDDNPHISLIYPNGGEKWYFDNTYKIKWNAENYDGKLNIALASAYSNTYGNTGYSFCNLGSTTADKEEFSIKLIYGMSCLSSTDPIKNIYEGNYKVYLYIPGEGMGSFSSESKEFFSIKKISLENDDSCLPGYVYNPLTGKKCSTSTINSCKAGQKYDAITGMLCPQQGINWGMLQRVLKRGVKGNDVALIQAYLGITADGNFGPATEQKVIEWQAQNGLTPDGKFGEKSRLKAELED